MLGKAKTGASCAKKGIKNTDEAIDAIKDEIKELCTNGKYFTGDTLVYTSQGYKPIKEIRKGDEVYSRDEKTGEISLKEVVEVFCTTAHTIYHIWVAGKEEFKTTAYHPVYVREQGWVTAINLREGDTIETMDGFVHITKVKKTRHEEAVPVYNFHVKDWTSYFVGKIKCYVHNNEGIKHIEYIDQLISDLESGKVKLHNLSSDEQLKVTEKLKEKAPLKTDGKVNISVRGKNGYDDIQYKWNFQGYDYEMRWHTATPNAPAGTPPNWRVDRKKPGFPGGKDPVTGKKLQGYPSIKEVLIWPENGKSYYVSKKVWEEAGKAYRKGTATHKQLDMLKFGHYIQK